MTHEELQQFAEDNWSRVNPEKRKACVEHLRSELSVSETSDLKKTFEQNDWSPWWHFDGGMYVRNLLRDVMKDDELPGVRYPGGDTYEFRNWDDFYMAALRQAVAPKEGEV